jgi:hypothetical protein
MFAVFGVIQAIDGRVTGTEGGPFVARASEPGLFWLFIAAYFLIAFCLLVIAFANRSPEDRQ